jgi:hypothetical protein
MDGIFLSSLLDAHIIRTYPKDYHVSDTESEGEAQSEGDTDGEEHHKTPAKPVV